MKILIFSLSAAVLLAACSSPRQPYGQPFPINQNQHAQENQHGQPR